MFKDNDTDNIQIQRLLKALKAARKEVALIKQIKNEPIAVIGMACRIPSGICTLEQYWNLLINGQDAITEIPSERWEAKQYYDPEPGVKGKMYTDQGGFLANVDMFDAEFFGISAREAICIDPQQRILLEVTWEAMENAGLVPENNQEKEFGIFVGISGSDYSEFQGNVDLNRISPHSITGSTLNAAAGRLAFTFGFKGPCMAIDTACSSSLVAVHQACQSLREGESELAFAAGVNLILSPKGAIALSQNNVLARDGRCKTFDAAADGMVRSEGCGVLVLKLLSEAEAAGDRILALINGSAVNQDGASSGFTVPNGLAQEQLFIKALANAKIEPEQIQYVEAHGTGTALGDPIELAAIANIYGKKHKKEQPLYVGSVKSNMGHAESASGILGIIKTILALNKQCIPKNLHFNCKTPHFNWDKHAVQVPCEAIAWPANAVDKRIAAVSGFGFSGTNAHIIISEHKKKRERDPSKQGLHALKISAKSLPSLKNMIINYIEKLVTTDNLSDFCYMANVRRSNFKYRICVVAADKDQMINKLSEFLQNNHSEKSVYYGEVAYQKKIPLAKGSLVSIEEYAEKYCQDYSIDWTCLYPHTAHPIIDLPNYSFERKPYWLLDHHHNRSKKEIDHFFYSVNWEAKTLPEQPHLSKKHWLLVADRQGIMLALAKKLRMQGHRCTLLMNNQNDSLMDSIENDLSIIVIQEWSDSNLFRQSQSIESLNSAITGVLVGLGLDVANEADNIEMPNRNLNQLEDLMILYQGLKKAFKDKTSSLPLVAYTCGAFKVKEDEDIDVNPWLGPITTFSKALSDEFSILTCSCIDLQQADKHPLIEQMLESLYCLDNELFSAYREKQRYVARLEPYRLTKRTNNFFVRSDLCYLITGGTGVLGMQMARYLIKKGAKNLVLVSREAKLKAVDEEWVNSLATQDNHVWIDKVDVKDWSSMKELFKKFGSDLPKLGGIIHAAGVVEDAGFENLTVESFSTNFAPKVMGAWNLHVLSQNMHLDFFILYSSIAALFPAPCQSAYAAANGFLDALAHYRQGLALPALSINWGPWEYAGMASKAVVKKRIERLKMNSFLLADSENIIDSLLNLNATQVVALDANWHDLADEGNSLMQHLLVQKQPVSGNESTVSFLEHLISLNGLKRDQYFEMRLAEHIRRILGNGQEYQIEQTTSFREMGFDSLMMVELGKSLSKDIEQQVSPAIFYDYTTIETLIHYLLQKLCLRDKEQLVEPLHSDHSEEKIAIVGMACRFPGKVNDVESFWNALITGIDLVDDMGNKRWNINDYYDPDPNAQGKMYSKRAGLIDNIEMFDAEFFNISPREAKNMDPQQRILLETCWEALENAGYSQTDLMGSRGGVFIGPGTNEYIQLQTSNGNMTEIDAHMGTGNALSAISGRISFFFGWHGPSITIDTACSSSLVAVHQACQSLRLGECDHAFAGGINLILQPTTNIMLSRAGMLAADGKCKTFDESADGYVRSEGCGVVVLKRLINALEDNDNIIAIISGTAINQDGRSHSLSSPNGLAQEAVIRQALANSKHAAEEISYVESHGTGTKLGDPIEIKAIYKTYIESCNRKVPLVIGALKSNMGHAEAAAGIAGLIKAALSVKLANIPPNIHFTKLNFLLTDDGMDKQMEFPVKQMRWSNLCKERIAAVSSFGFTGTNAHLILESMDIEPSVEQSLPNKHILLVSARSLETLQIKINDYIRILKNKEIHLQDFCYTANTGRTHFQVRTAVVGADREELIFKLNQQLKLSSEDIQTSHLKKNKECIFVLTGSSFKDPFYAYQLYMEIDCFKESIEECEQILMSLYNISIKEMLKINEQGLGVSSTNIVIEKKQECMRTIERMRYSVMIFSIEYALAKLLLALGLEPSVYQVNQAGLYVVWAIMRLYSLSEIFGFMMDSDPEKLTSAISNSSRYENIVLLQDLPEKEMFLAEKSNMIKLEELTKQGNRQALYQRLAHFYMQGITIHWQLLYKRHLFNRIPLPTYPFQRDRYWLEGCLMGESKSNKNACDDIADILKLSEQTIDDVLVKMIEDSNES